MMSIFKHALDDITGGRVLDVATGRGSSIGVLKECFKSYTEIVGIDVNERAIESARNSYEGDNIQFIRMDAERLGFKDQSFDTVNVSKSLHHFANVPQVLSEMKRVLKSRGYLIVCDMHRDAQTEAQRTDVYIHHWAAEVDTQLGFSHHRTFARQELIDIVEGLGFSNFAFYDWLDTDSDPMDAEALHEKEEIIARYLQRAREVPDFQILEQRGKELRRRLYEVGIQSEPVLIMVGEKQ
jgi:SAM-dependent methyltransferase